MTAEDPKYELPRFGQGEEGGGVGAGDGQEGFDIFASSQEETRQIYRQGGDTTLIPKDIPTWKFEIPISDKLQKTINGLQSHSKVSDEQRQAMEQTVIPVLKTLEYIKDEDPTEQTILAGNREILKAARINAALQLKAERDRLKKLMEEK